MSSVDYLKIDVGILSATRLFWRKVALVIAEVVRKMSSDLPDGDASWDLVSERIEILVQDGRLLAQGNVKNWRHSEVKRPA